MLDGATDCPLYASFPRTNTDVIRYLVEIRDCVVGPKGNRGKMVDRFTYNDGINLMTQCREFSELVVGSIVEALVLLRAERTPVFAWHKA